jgi:hypothetical protein
MKNILLLCLIAFSSASFGQGNLQFNRALTITAGESYTVPPGKVFKVESINMNNTTVCIPRSSEVNFNCQQQNGTWSASTYGVYNSITYMTIANMNFTTPSFSGNTNPNFCSGVVNAPCWNWNFGSISLNTPIWLEAGKQVNIHSGVAAVLISGIEFNIVP